MDLQVINDIANDTQRSSGGDRPYFAEVAEVVGNKVKLKIDGDTDVVDTLYITLQVVNVGDRVCLYYAGSQIIVMGAVR